MSTSALLERLERTGVRLTLHEDKLRYSAPAGTLTAEMVDELRAHKEGLIRLLKSRAAQGAAAPAAGAGACHPASVAQQRLWFLEQLDTVGAAYNTPFAVRLHGELDLAALGRAFDAVVARHDSLRTCFHSDAGVLMQRVLPPFALPLPLIDLSAEAGEAADRRAEAIAREQSEAKFDLEAGPLIRVCLLKRGPATYDLLCTVHHIVADGWSLELLVTELGRLYAAYREGHTPFLPKLPIQYSDYSRWQLEWLSGAPARAQLGWWQEQLREAPPLLTLATDRPRRSAQSFRGAQVRFEIPAPLLAPFAEACRRAEATLFMGVAALYTVLLARFSGQQEICFGTPVANRHRVELEHLIGLFINTIVIRNRRAPADSFESLLARTREVVAAAFAHQEVPFETVVELLRPSRDLSHAPLVQAMLIWQNSPPGDWALPGLTLERRQAHSGFAKFDLTLEAAPRDGGLLCALEYNSDLFDRASAERIAAHFQLLLAEAGRQPHTPIACLPALEAAEARRVLVEWNATARLWPQGAVERLFGEQAGRTPEAVALVCGSDRITFAQLELRSNALAWWLGERGIGPEALVALCLDRSIEMVVCLLGILKAGAAYLPLDPEYPEARIAYILEDARPAALISHSAPAARLGLDGVAGVQLLVDRDRELLAALRSDPPPPRALAAHRAYVIYTSGSTGRPKGVEVTRGGMANFIHAMGEAPGIAAGDCLLQLTSLSFDIAVLEIFLPLVAGARVVIARREEATDPQALRALIAEGGVSMLQATPASWRMLLEEGPGEIRLARGLCGGEALSPDLARQIGAVCGELWNMYGPTETTVWSTLQRVAAGDPQPGIGRPIANTEIYLLDPDLNPVPVGVSGELYIAGTGLARGYLGRPDLTAERFLPNPFSDAPGARMYRTGDLARRLADGSLDYLGRQDSQVKLRGFRIELGEIEAALAGFAEIGQAVVAVHEAGAGDRRLVAWLVGREPGGLTERFAELRERLRRQLPEYMVPSQWVELSELPLTPNGKVDRKRLPAPQGGGREEGYVAPRGGEERLLAQIWAQVLKLERVGVNDNFFDLGGHSLLATQVISKVRSAFGVELPLRALFEAPTIGQLAARLGAAEGAAEAIPPAPREAALPLSFAQQRLWFLEQLEGGSAVYNIPVALRLSGELDLPALSGAIATVVRRHEVLRTRIEVRGEVPVQVVDPAGDLPLPLLDLSGLPAARREARAEAALREEGRAPFDLARGPLMRARLLRLAADEHRLLLTLHHIVADGWSMGVLVEELTALYAAAVAGRTPALRQLPIQYADFAHWQRRTFTGPVRERELEYWRKRLEGAPPLLALPTDHPRPALQSYRGGWERFELSARRTAALHALCAQQQATPFMGLAALLTLLLSRYTRQADICLGSSIANRTRGELEPLIGLFANTIVLRNRVNPRASFTALLKAVRGCTLEAYAHQHLPFEQLVEALVRERDLSYSPLVQVMLTLQNAPMGALQLPGLTLSRLADHNGTAKFDLSLELYEEQGCLRGGFEYNLDLFEPATIRRMADHFGRLLDAAVSLPAGAVGDLPMLGEPERQRLLREFNDTRREYPAAGTLSALFEAQAARTPHAPAVAQEGATLTYAELNRRANQLAHYLRQQGVGADDRVAICAERSLELVVGLLGIVKAGGAYVPLDPDYPRERLSYMVQDAAPKVLLTQARLRPLAAAIAGPLPALCLDEAWPQVAPFPAHDPAPAAGPAHIAYVIYTSGSTGRPKGVAVDHRGIVNRLQWMQEAYRLTPADRVLQKTPFSFDVSVWEFFWTLANGALLVMAAPGGHQDPHYLAEALVRERVTVAHFVPPMLEVFLNALPAGYRSELRLVVCSGQALPYETRSRFLERFEEAALQNLYGPTEASVDVTAWDCRSEQHPGCVPIGLPIANTALYVLDPELEPVPVGVMGELYIAGVGLARGYLGQPALTADRFIPNPFEGSGARMYRTGDLARYLADGSIDYLGRTDDQVKIRGFRIELGEIEAALAALPAVREAVVVARDHLSGGRQLIAYVVAAPGAAGAGLGAGLREALKRSLPDYMVPAQFIALEALPLTPNGKVDRAALPAPERPACTADDTPPATPLEQTVAAIWAEVLDLPQVGRESNFFEAGGHSLLATQVVARIKERLGVHLPLRALFEAPTVRLLCALLPAAQAAAPETIPPAPRGEPLPLSFAQQRLWFLSRMEPGAPHYNIPVALRLDGPLEVAAFVGAVNEIVRRHEVLRTRFVGAEGGPVQLIEPAAPLPIAMVDLEALASAEREAAAAERVQAEARTGFDLENGLPIRVQLIRLAPDRHLALFTFHHIVADGWSLGILVKELAALYDACRRGQPSPLPELPIQYGDFAHWQRRWFDGELRERQLSYWRERLRGAPGLLALPTDRPRPAVQTQRGGAVPFELPRESAEALRAMAGRAGGTLFMALAAATSLLLARYSGQRDLCLGTSIANRNRVQLEGLIGFFVNTLVLRCQIDPNEPFTACFDRLREETLAAYAHQEAPFEQVIEAVNIERSLSHPPLVQVMLALQNAPMKPPALAGLELHPLPPPEEFVKFDLVVEAFEEAGGLRGSFQYNADLFERATIARMVRSWLRLLCAIAADPACRVGDLPLLDQEEARAVAAMWSGGAGDAPFLPVHQRVARQARATPEAPAVITPQGQWSYGQLRAEAEALAARLRRYGVGRGAVVALCAGRSPAMVAAMLAVQEAGAAYLPLDADYPPERLAYILGDAAPAVLVTSSELLAQLPPIPAGIELLLLDADPAPAPEGPAAPPPVAVGEGDLAYVIYTSGSTGKPKGVMLTHGGFANLIAQQIGLFGVRPGQRVLQFASFNFDASTWEIFLALAGGAALCMADRRSLLPGAGLERLVASLGVEMVVLPPSALGLIDPAGLPGLKTVIAGGEACPAALIARWSGGGRRFFNAYGPTETTVCASVMAYDGGEGRALIGRPVANTGIYILDGELNPVPVGVSGELYIAGAGLARGYLGRPDLTAERFLPDPFSGLPGARMYRTGDLARFLADGNLDYLGRQDSQVKLRGFRIELGEIEAVLAGFAEVAQAAVALREAGAGDRRLVAWLVGREPGGLAARFGEFKERLRRQLPEYMVPAHWVELSELPLTPNGKVDRERLPAPQGEGRAEGYLAPRGGDETLLAEIWGQVLGLERVGVNDNFFDLGGHSLLATRVISKVESVFGVALPLRALFEAPTIEQMAALLGAAEAAAGGAAVIPPAPREAALPLSFAQQRLWFLEQLEGGGPLYHIPLALRLSGDLDLSALTAALQGVVRRHEVLRTRFGMAAGAPVQIVDPAGDLAVPLLDLSGLAEAEREAQAAAQTQAEASAPFDLARGPLMRVRILRLAADEHRLLLTLHHIVADGWSMGVLVREVAELYRAAVAGTPPALPELAIQYADFAHWQRQWLQGERLERQLAYWRDRLAGALPVLELPGDRPRPAIQRFVGARHPFTLPAALGERLGALGRAHGATLFMTLLAAFKVLLMRHSGQSDLCVGTPIANRQRPELEGLVGLFVNTLVLRSDLSGNPSFLDLLGRLREGALSAYAHQELPFEQLVDALKPERELGHTPLFQVLFVLQNAPMEPLRLPGLTLAAEEVEVGTAKFDLTLQLAEGPEGLSGAFEYNSDLFDPATVAAMAARWQRLLEAVAEDPSLPIGELALLPAEELARQLQGWNDCDAPWPRERTVAELFEAQAARSPEAVAVVWEQERLTYAELNGRANRLAWRLRELGVGPGARVGLCLPRAPEMVVGVLAVLKAGGAYVPLDPGYPQERLAYMVADAGLRVLVAAPGVAVGRLEAVARIEAAGAELAAHPAGNPPRAGGPELPGYVIYTSGSTGRPKGAGVYQQGMVNLLTWYTGQFAIGPADRLLLVTSFSFDLTQKSLIGPLLTGGRLCLAAEPFDAHAIAALVQREGVTLLNLTPSAFQAIVEAAAPGQLDSLRVVFLGGEPVTWGPLRRLAALGARPQVVNTYGPTECTDVAVWHLLERDDGGSVPIGRPVPNCRLYVLDEAGAPLPTGAAGELYIGGVGVGSGYLNDPRRTAERFLPDPFGPQAGARIYRTGDRVRYRADGRLEFLGRLDQQVKVRGFRIEPGEVEAILSQHPGLQEAVVCARDDGAGLRLVAYVAGGGAAPAALRSWLRERLPEYMVPSAFVVLERLPLSPNGKVDRAALPAPHAAAGSGAYVAPRSAEEQALAQIWADLLGVERVGIEDNFFELGGNSLLAVTLIERMKGAGLEVDVRTLFTTPVIAGLAARRLAVGKQAEIPAKAIPAGCSRITPPMVPLAQLTQSDLDRISARVHGGPANIDDIYPLTPLQEGILFHHLRSQGNDAYLMPLLLSFDGRERLDRFVAALAAVVARHDVLRTCVVWDGLDRPVQVVLRQVPLTAEPLSAQAGRELSERLAEAVLNGRYRISVEEAPLIRLHYTREGENGRFLLLLLAHHLVCDHRTLELLLEEVQALIEEPAARLPAPLPFREFVARLDGRAAEAAQQFFTGMLGAVSEPTHPFGLAEVHGDGARNREAKRSLEPALGRRLLRQAQRLGVGTASLVHLAWALVLARVSGHGDVVFGTVLLGRMQGGEGVSRMLGLFINTLPVRIPVDGRPVAEAVREVQRTLAQLLAHEQASLALAQRCSAVEPPTPLFSALLNYRFTAPAAEQGQWQGMELLELRERTSYPLTLNVDDDMAGGVALVVQAAPAVRPEQVCDYMVTALTELVEALESDPGLPLSRLDPLPAAERHELVTQWGLPQGQVATGSNLVALFEAQAAKSPQAPALWCGGAQLSYAELNARANRLAHRLRALGAGPERLVGICLDRTPELVVGLLAILKAGSAYVPLDPEYPRQRIEAMLGDADPVVLVTERAVEQRLPGLGGAVVKCCLDAVEELAGYPSHNPEPCLRGENLAYVIYTSGSTGRPKGVAITHRSSACFVHWALAAFTRDDLQAVLASTSVCFDLSVFELFVPLACGGSVYLVRSAVADGDRLRQLPVTLLNTVPSVAAELTRLGALPPSVRVVNLAGEALSRTLVEATYASGPVAAVYNLYGPTEDTTYSTFGLMEREAATAPTIGRPIANTRVYLLDGALRPVPAGVPGDLYIAGDGLARGYLGRPDLTAERFLPDPFAAEPGARMYQTGDLARFLPSGEIDYLGRADGQVKIRGFRIEVGEIETVLKGLPAIRDAAVVAREVAAGEKRLVAYYVREGQEAAGEGPSLRATLRERLPEYMVPAHFVELPALPLTLNGKVDRKALPAPAATAGRAPFVAPRTPTEQLLAGIWAELLKVDQVGIDDDFFELGGHSLLATQVVSKVRAAFGAEFSLQALFEHTTIKAIAQELDARLDQFEEIDL